MMSKGNGQQARTTAQVNADLKRLAEERAKSREALAAAERSVQASAVLRFRGSKDAAVKAKEAREARAAAAGMIEELVVVEGDLRAELAAAEAAEDRERREKHAAEAELFAKELASAFCECDGVMLEFRKSFSKLWAMLKSGMARGFKVPHKAVLDVNLALAIKSSFSPQELAGMGIRPLGANEKRNFRTLGAGIAEAVLGGAHHVLNPPKPKSAVPPPQAAKPGGAQFPPKQSDVGRRLPGDGDDFEVRIIPRR